MLYGNSEDASILPITYRGEEGYEIAWAFRSFPDSERDRGIALQYLLDIVSTKPEDWISPPEIRVNPTRVTIRDIVRDELCVSDYEWAVYGITRNNPNTWNTVGFPEELLKYQEQVTVTFSPNIPPLS